MLHEEEKVGVGGWGGGGGRLHPAYLDLLIFSPCPSHTTDATLTVACGAAAGLTLGEAW